MRILLISQYFFTREQAGSARLYEFGRMLARAGHKPVLVTTFIDNFRKEVPESFPPEESRFGIEPEITAKIAARHWRVFEVGISYSGRTYDEGKKIGWKDGIRAFYCIVRYSPPVARRISALSERTR